MRSWKSANARTEAGEGAQIDSTIAARRKYFQAGFPFRLKKIANQLFEIKAEKTIEIMGGHCLGKL
jgi:hypothetical protein